jgi:MFS family permease
MDINRKKRLESNIWKYYAYYFLHLFFLFGAILTVYFLDIDLSLSKIMFMGSLTWIVSLILEVPSGIISDLYGRKTTLVISSLGYLLWVVFLVIFENYLILLVSSIFCGIRLSFKSGSDSALLYDTLKELKRENEHPKISGKAVSFLLVGAAISAPLGSTIASLTSIKFTIFLTMFIALCSVFITLSFQEPKSYTKNADKSMFNHLGKSVAVCLENNKLKWLIIFLSTLAALFTMVFSYTQVFLKDYNPTLTVC